MKVIVFEMYFLTKMKIGSEGCVSLTVALQSSHDRNVVLSRVCLRDGHSLTPRLRLLS